MTSLTRAYALASTYRTRQEYAKSLALSLKKHVIMSLKDVLDKSKMLGIWLMSPEISMDNCACATALRKVIWTCRTPCYGLGVCVCVEGQ